MNPFFDLKQSVVGIFSTHKAFDRAIAGENELSNSEERLFGKIADFEHDSESIQQLRSQNRNNIVKLQSALARVDSREESKSEENFLVEERTVKEWREYEKSLRTPIETQDYVKHIYGYMTNPSK